MGKGLVVGFKVRMAEAGGVALVVRRRYGWRGVDVHLVAGVVQATLEVGWQ